jgi:hypothetical protein
MPLNGHSERIANEQNVNTRFIEQSRKGHIVSGNGTNLRANLLSCDKLDDRYFFLGHGGAKPTTESVPNHPRAHGDLKKFLLDISTAKDERAPP